MAEVNGCQTNFTVSTWRVDNEFVHYLITQMRLLIVGLFIVLAVAGGARAQVAPAGDYHQHLFSPEIVRLLTTPASPPQPILAKDVIELLDAAGIKAGNRFS